MQSNDTDELLAGLSVVIGTIMEDEVTDVVSVLPKGCEPRAALFSTLQAAGRDIAALADAAMVILRGCR